MTLTGFIFLMLTVAVTPYLTLVTLYGFWWLYFTLRYGFTEGKKKFEETT